MDPYLEGELWQEFHDTLINAVRAQLMPRLRPKYVALLAKRYVLDRPALGVLDLPLEQRVLFDRRPKTEVWAISLREELLIVPIPLLPPDEDVSLDLQTAVNACFELVGYEYLLNYQEPPPPSAFSPQGTAWITEQLQAAAKTPQ